MRTAKIGIAIISYNSVGRIAETLSSLKESLSPFSPENIEVLLWDNASTDGTVNFVRQNFPWVKVVAAAQNSGFAGGNNRASEALKPCDYLVLLNDDTVADKNWLLELITAAQSDPAVMTVQAQLRLWSDKMKLNSWGNCTHYLGYGFAGGNGISFSTVQAQAHLSGNQEIAYASGAAMLIKTALLKETFLFDDLFFLYSEDQDLGWRCKLLGYKNIIAPKSIVYHKYEFKKSIGKFFYMERNRYLVLLRNYKWASLILIAPALLVMEAGTFVFSLFSGWYKEKLKVYAFLLRPGNWPMIFNVRQKIQTTRRVKDREVVTFFSGTIDFQEASSPVLMYLVNPCLKFYWRLVRMFILW